MDLSISLLKFQLICILIQKDCKFYTHVWMILRKRMSHEALCSKCFIKNQNESLKFSPKVSVWPKGKVPYLPLCTAPCRPGRRPDRQGCWPVLGLDRRVYTVSLYIRGSGFPCLPPVCVILNFNKNRRKERKGGREGGEE